MLCLQRALDVSSIAKCVVKFDIWNSVSSERCQNVWSDNLNILL